MKTRLYRLQPPIETIKENLFAPPLSLLNSWLSGEALDDEDKQVLENNPWAENFKHVSEELVLADSESSATAIPLELELPGHLKELIRREIDTKRYFASDLPYEMGQIRLLCSVSNKQISLPDKPLSFLLVKEMDTTEGKLWHGYLLASETAWAGYWDMLLEPEDEPFSPIAGMIQIWNPMVMRSNNLGQVIGQLSPQRMQVVKSMAYDYLFAEACDPKDAHLGHVYGRNTSQGMLVLTGSPLAEDDPRHEYQLMYHQAAHLMSDSLPLVDEVGSTISVLDAIEKAINSAVDKVKIISKWQPEVAFAMGNTEKTDQAKTKCLLYNQHLQLNFSFLDDLIRVQAVMLNDDSCQLKIKKGDIVERTYDITQEEGQGFDIDPDEVLSLVIEYEQCATVRIDFPLKNNDD